MHSFRGWILLAWCCHFCCWADFSSDKKRLTFRVQLAWHPHWTPLKGKKNTSTPNVADELRWIKDPLSKQNSGVKRHHSSFMLRVSFETIKWQVRNPRGLLCLHHFLKNMDLPWHHHQSLGLRNGLRQESAPSRVARAFGRVSDASSTATVSERGMAMLRSWQLEDTPTYNGPYYICWNADSQAHRLQASQIHPTFRFNDVLLQMWFQVVPTAECSWR